MHGVLPGQVSDRLPSIAVGHVQRWLGVVLLCGIVGCSSLPSSPDAQPEILPLKVADHSVGLEDVTFLAPTPELLALDDEMEAFVARYTRDLRSQRGRLNQLHRAIRGNGVLNLQYDPYAEGSAAEAFHRGTVNCLSYANLFVAMAREAGLNARYQWVDVRPRWSRLGERVAVSLHVNVLVRVRDGAEYMADIDPLRPGDITGTRVISDQDAQALYHSNIAMDALSEESLDQAWAHAVRAVQLAPKMGHLWVNLGAVYRRSGQHDAAEQSYLYALQLDSQDRSAMNNLVVLYELQGRADEQAHWQQRIARYQGSNPYYHAWLGDKAGEEGNWPLALTHYQEALSLARDDSRLLYATGLIYHHLEELTAASRLITEAIAHATLRSEIQNYQTQLDVVKREQLARL
jgi:Flp pilus assembly protein TadD